MRTRAAGGSLLMRSDDLDAARCRPEFVAAFREDLRWLGCEWEEPMVSQSERMDFYRAAMRRLVDAGAVYPCFRSRKDVAEASSAPHGEDGGLSGDEAIFPKEWRPKAGDKLPSLDEAWNCNWRFRVPDGEGLVFVDGNLGEQRAVAGELFGDFLVWRRDKLPSYQLACAVDDAEMGITEVVRGADLALSTFRQLLILRALGLAAPAYFHCDLVRDAEGRRLAKRSDALALRELRRRGFSAEAVRKMWEG